MTPDAAVVQGTLKDDGTLELDKKPSIAPGRVQVTISAIPAPADSQPRRTLIDVLDEIHSAQRSRGYRGRSLEEMEHDDAQRRAEDDEYEESWRRTWKQTTSAPPSEDAVG